MSYNGSGTFQINSSGQPVITGTTISSTDFNALTADLATGLSTAITKDGQTTTTARIPFALGINSTLVTDATNTTSGSIITAGGVGIAKALFVGTTANVAGAVTLGGVATFSAQPIFSSLTASSAVATDASKGLVSVTNTGTGNNVLATTPTIATPSLTSPTISDGTANGVGYLNGSKVLTTGSTLTFDGTTLSTLILAVTGTSTLTGVATLTAQPILSSLTASKPVFTDASKGLVSTGTLGADQGGTGVANNAAMTVTGSGNFAYTRTLTGTTNVTLPTTGTLATLAGSETFTNKTLTTPNIDSAQIATVSGTAPLYMARAWVNFNGSANTNLTGTYSQSGTTVTVTATAHGLIVGSSINADITSGTGVDGIYTVTAITTANIFTYTAGTSLTTSGNITLLRNTIRGSGNVSSITDNGTGDYTINFTTAMSDANYSIGGSTGFNGGGSAGGFLAPNRIGVTGVESAPTTTSCRVNSSNIAGSETDAKYTSVVIYR